MGAGANGRDTLCRFDLELNAATIDLGRSLRKGLIALRAAFSMAMIMTGVANTGGKVASLKRLARCSAVTTSVNEPLAPTGIDAMYCSCAGGAPQELCILPGCSSTARYRVRPGHLTMVHTGCGFRATITHARAPESADPDGRPADLRCPAGLRRQSSQDTASGQAGRCRGGVRVLLLQQPVMRALALFVACRTAAVEDRCL